MVGEMIDLVRATIPTLLSILVAITTSYVVLWKENVIQQERISSLEINIKVLETSVSNISKLQSDIKGDLLALRVKEEKTAEAFTMISQSLRDVSKSLTDLSIAVGRMDERIKGLEVNRGE